MTNPATGIYERRMMAIDEQKFKRLKQQAEEAKAAADRAEGAYTNTMETIAEEFDVATIEDARKALDKLRAEAKKLETKYNKAVTKFEKLFAASEDGDDDDDE